MGRYKNTVRFHEFEMNSSVEEMEVVRHYIKCEIGKVVKIWEQSEGFVEDLDKAVDELPDEESVRLARYPHEALGLRLHIPGRSNAIFHVITFRFFGDRTEDDSILIR